VIGWQSEGQTIIEAGIAAALCVVVMGTIRGIWSHVDAQTLGLAVAIPFVPAVVGAWIGEKVQGDTIETQD